MFSHLQAAPDDPILGLMAQFRKDPRPGKIDLGVGVYRDEAGRTFVVLLIHSKPVDRAFAVPVRTATFVGLLNLHHQPQPVEVQP